MIGRTIAHYEIRSKIGAGGMGVVYRAWDTVLERDVALKFLPEELARDEAAHKRFLREARAAAALDHENICTVHEVGEAEGHAFIVMRYVEGVSLRDRLASGPVPLGETLETVAQIARGLSAAHKSGIFHRDVKPANVILTTENQAKIVDFGLAKLTSGTDLTQEGATLGTVAYMSPEQAGGGGEVDGRTDVWALGVVLYEMLAGRRPFDADADQATLYSILNTNAEPVSSINTGVPLEVERVVDRALEKDTSKRYASIDEFLADIEELRRRQTDLSGAHPFRRWLKRRRKHLAAAAMLAVFTAAVAFAVWQFGPWGGDGKIDSLAVLPFDNLTPGEDQDLMTNGVFIEVISHLTNVEGIKKVSPRRAVMAYGDTVEPMGTIGSELGVKGIVTGTFQQEGDRIRITADLIDVRNGSQIWSQHFEGRLTDILSLQAQIARAIADEIEVTLTPTEREILTVEREVDPAAYEQLELAKKKLFECLVEEKYQVCGDVEPHALEAVKIDSTYVEAWAYLSTIYAYKCQHVDEDEEASCRLAREYAMKALSVDDKSIEAHLALAAVYLVVDLDFEAADRQYQRAIAITGSVAKGMHYSTFLMQSGRFTEAIDLARRNVELNPVDYMTLNELGHELAVARRYDEAIAQYLKVLELFPGEKMTIDQLRHCYFITGRFEEGLALDEESGYVGNLEYLALTGQREDSVIVKFFNRYKAYRPGAYYVAKMYCRLGDEPSGDLDSAMVYLDKAYAIQPEDLIQINTDPEFDILRPDPRFQALMKRAGIPAGELEYLYHE